MRLVALLVLVFGLNYAFASDFKNGLAALHNKQYSKAIGYFSQATEAQPTSVSAWNNLGISYFKLRKYGYAIHAFQMAAKLDPSDTHSQENIELCYQKLEKTPRIDEAYSSTQKVAYQIGGFKLNMLALVFSTILAFLLFKLLKRGQTMKNVYLIISIPVLFLLITCIFLSVKASTYLQSYKNAVVVQSNASLFVNEMGKLSDEMLSEGSSVEVIGKKEGFYEIKGSVGQTLYLRKVDCKVY